MSRWDRLNCEPGEDKGRRTTNDSWRNRRNIHNNDKPRWPSSTGEARQQRPSWRGRISQQHAEESSRDKKRPQMRRRNADSVVISDAAPKQCQQHRSIPGTERDALVDSLKSQLFRYRSENNKVFERTILIVALRKLLQDTTRISHAQTLNAATIHSDVFVTLIGLLEIEEGGDTVTDDEDAVRFVVAQCLESYLSCFPPSATPETALTKCQVEMGINALSSHFIQSKTLLLSGSTSSSGPTILNSTLMVCLALLVKSHANHLAPEWTAQRVVGGIFLPYVSSSSLSVECPNPEAASRKKQAIKYACEALNALLNIPSHASAILAPLVQDVSILSDYGVEEQTSNPLRMKLLSVLLARLKPSETTNKNEHNTTNGRKIEEQVVVCRTLTATMNAIRKLRKGDETNSDSQNKADLQILTPVQNFIVQVISIERNNSTSADNEALMQASLQLLRALIACYPNDMTGMGWKLVIESANRSENHSVLSSLLSTTADRNEEDNVKLGQHGISIDSMALAMNCLADFISLLPWDRWVKQNVPTNGKRSILMSKASTSGLYKSVVNALYTTIEVVTKFFDGCYETRLMGGLGRLVKTLFLDIPYYDAKLISVGSDLWGIVIKASRSDTIPRIRTLVTSEQKRKVAVDILIASAGGTVTPQGNLRGMSVPARTWLLSEKASVEVFMKELMNQLQSSDVYLDWSFGVLSSLMRTLPEIALRRWDSFRKIFQSLNTNAPNNKEKMRFEVLEAFMLGRRDFDVSKDLRNTNDTIITDVDGILLRKWSQNTLRQCLSIYSAFRSQDWMQLNNIIDGRVRRHFDTMLEHCHSANSKTREAAAKAVGEFCTNYMLPNSSPGSSVEENKTQEYRSIAVKVSTSMVELSTDQYSGARSNSIFCLGNLGSALNESGYKDLVSLYELQGIAKAILRCCNDTNMKVVKNAIRSIGHIGNLLAWSLRSIDQNNVRSSSCKLVVEIIETLSRKLSNTLHVALNEEQKASMTWKERSAAKKHGWGACHSLGLVFEGLSVEIFQHYDAFVPACSEAIRCLVLCPSHYARLTEKIVLAAMAAVDQLPSQLLTLTYENAGHLGDALAISILILEHSQTIHNVSPNDKNMIVTSKLATQNQAFLRHLLSEPPSVASTTKALSDDRVSKTTLDALYAWMVEDPQLQVLPGRAFEAFAIALQGCSEANVGLEQQFTSRALQQYKNERRSSSKSFENTTRIASWNSDPGKESNNDEDEADEL